jgi:hypothetical protein
MATLWSKLFASLETGSGSSSYPVPAGYIWVVRDISGFIGAGSPAGGFYVQQGSSGPVFYYVLGSGTAQWFHVGDMRVVIPEGSEFNIAVISPGGHINVSGYQLTAP